MKLLLVQDRTSETVLRQCLAERGYEVVVCRDVQEAKDLCASDFYPLIVLDLTHLADAQGFCRLALKRPYSIPSLLLVGVSGEAEDLAELIAAGADDFLPRPYVAREVRRRLLVAEHQIQQKERWEQTEEVLQTRAQQQVAIAAMGQAAVSEDLPTLLDLVSRFMVHTLDVEFCGVLEVAEGEQKLSFVAGFGWREGYLGHSVPWPPPESVTGRTLRGEEVMLEDMDLAKVGSTNDFLREHGVVSGLSVGIKIKSEVKGVLGAYTAQKRRFVEGELRFLEGLANIVGAAMARQRSEAESHRQQAQLQHLQRLESVGQMAAALSHDYNNVLTIIHGHVTLAVGEAGLPTKAASSLRTALEAVERAAGLTRQLLSFSRKQSLQLEVVEINSAIASLARLLDRVLGKSIHLEFKPSPLLPMVLADTGLLDQALINLATNARDAMPGGGTLLIRTDPARIDGEHVRFHPEARAGDFVRLLVSDSGCGMDEATMRRIFEPFFTTKEPGKGTGLGLSTVYGIVRQHQGWVQVQSQPGQGTTFSLFLPALAGNAPEAVPAPAPPATHATVLLVEVEPTLRELARLRLCELGYAVVEAGSATEAFSIWSEQKPSIQGPLTDLILPDGCTGFELAQRLQHEQPDLKVIFSSGYNMGKLKEALPVGLSCQVVQKPYQSESLAKALRECFEPQLIGPPAS